jgi:hypothetical protein
MYCSGQLSPHVCCSSLGTSLLLRRGVGNSTNYCITLYGIPSHPVYIEAGCSLHTAHCIMF